MSHPSRTGAAVIKRVVADSTSREPLWITLVRHAILLPAVAVSIYPVLSVLSISLRPGDRLRSTDLAIIPDDWTVHSYIALFTDEPFLRWMGNSLFVSGAVTLTGVALDAPPVRTPDGEVFWRLRAETAGDHVLTLRAGDAVLEKGWAVGGKARKVPIKRTKSWDALLYPGEAGIDSSSPFYTVALHYPERRLPWLPDGELGVLLWFFALSLVAGFALKDVFGVTL